jgi:chemotaxis protein MotB
MEPYARTRKPIQKIAPALKAMPFRVSITGHTATSKVPEKPGYGPWELSADRANAVREILAGEGLSSAHVYMVAGKADTDPLFPDNPYMSPNRRVTITLMREAPPIPPDLTP